MANWLVYLKERFPLPVYIILVGGISLSASLLALGEVEWLGFALSFVGIMLFFALLRLMDELKDFEKDKIVHPRRPLPRGVLDTKDVTRVVHLMSIGLVLYAVVAGLLTSWIAGLCFLIVALWLWLMFKEFYLGPWLVERPLLYAVTHQLILIPLCGFAVLVHDENMIFKPAMWAYGFCVLGSFFSYEVCRKLDPHAHPLLKTYLAVYGIRKVVMLVLVLNVIAGAAAGFLGLGWWLWLFEALTIFVLVWIGVLPTRYKFAELAATVSLVMHIWALSFAFFLNFRN